MPVPRSDGRPCGSASTRSASARAPTLTSSSRSPPRPSVAVASRRCGPASTSSWSMTRTRRTPTPTTTASRRRATSTGSTPLVVLTFAAAHLAPPAGHRHPPAARAPARRRGQAGSQPRRTVEGAVRPGDRDRLVSRRVRRPGRAVRRAGRPDSGVRRGHAGALGRRRVVLRGAHVQFERVRSYPKPRDRRIPIVVGGNSDPTLARVAAWGDGWYGFNVPVATVPRLLADLHAHCRREGRDPGAVDVSVALADGSPDDVPALDRVGVDEVVLVESPPAEAGEVDRWVDGLADRWKVSG